MCGTHTRFLFFRRPLSNRHQYHRLRRLHHKLRLQRPMATRNCYRYLQYDSYDSLVQVRNWTNEDGENRQQTHYFHCDQIGIPREMSDKDRNLLWYGECTALGRLKKAGGSIGMHISPSACKTSMPTMKRGCIKTSSGIMRLMWACLWIRIRLGWWVGQTFISFRWMRWEGLIH